MCRMELSLLFFIFHVSYFCLLLLSLLVLPYYVVNKAKYTYLGGNAMTGRPIARRVWVLHWS